MMLAWTIYISFAVALLLAVWPRINSGLARGLALGASLVNLLLGLAALVSFSPEPGGMPRTLVNVPWIEALGINFHLAYDGISLLLVVLTSIAGVAGVLFSWNVEDRPAKFFALFLALIGGVYGVFLSFDVFLFFVFYEIAIIPKYFLIAIWGSTRREYGAMKLALYSFVGSAMVLVGIIAAFVLAGSKTMDLTVLAQNSFPRGFQMWAFPLVFTGFGILAGMWPFHTWAPTGHVAAPTAASMLLAGVVMKLGAYGCFRVAMPLFSGGLGEWGFSVLGLSSWREVFGVLALVGIIYGAGVALVQRDFKFVIGYSSVSHMGFVLLGLMTLNAVGLTGAVLQMFSHGVIAGLLFAVVGRMVYDRVHTRELTELEGLGLARALPFAGVTFTLASLASMGMPGFSGFIAELQVLIGAWKSDPSWAIAAGIGVLVGIAFTLRVLQAAFFGDREKSIAVQANPAASPAPAHNPVPPISLPERCGAILLLVVTTAVGLYPRVLIDLIAPCLKTPLFRGLTEGGAL